MSKQAITVDGEEKMVREDTAKAFRGTHWALISIAAFILIAALMFFGGLFHLATDDAEPRQTAPATGDRLPGS